MVDSFESQRIADVQGDPACPGPPLAGGSYDWTPASQKGSNHKIKDGLKYATTMGLDSTNQQHYHNEQQEQKDKSRPLKTGLSEWTPARPMDR